MKNCFLLSLKYISSVYHIMGNRCTLCFYRLNFFQKILQPNTTCSSRAWQRRWFSNSIHWIMIILVDYVCGEMVRRFADTIWQQSVFSSPLVAIINVEITSLKIFFNLVLVHYRVLVHFKVLVHYRVLVHFRVLVHYRVLVHFRVFVHYRVLVYYRVLVHFRVKYISGFSTLQGF